MTYERFTVYDDPQLLYFQSSFLFNGQHLHRTLPPPSPLSLLLTLLKLLKCFKLTYNNLRFLFRQSIPPRIIRSTKCIRFIHSINTHMSLLYD